MSALRQELFRHSVVYRGRNCCSRFSVLKDTPPDPVLMRGQARIRRGSDSPTLKGNFLSTERTEQAT